MLNTSKIRQDFPILRRKIHGKPLVYLDNAATTQKPNKVIKSIVDYYQKHNANIHRGIHTLSEEATSMYEQARGKIAQFIGASSPREIIFVRNSTEAINLVAYSWGRKHLEEKDEIIISESEHHSNIVPWQLLSKEKGVKLKYAPVSDNGYLEIEKLEKLISKKTKLISLTHLSNVFGVINPIKEIGKLARQSGVKLLVDGSQSVPRMPIDVRELKCDFLAITGHKMLGPTGIGVLYAREELLEDMPPFLGGGDMIREVYLDHSIWNEIPYKFEAGTPNIAGSIALGRAIDYLQSLGMNNVFHHEKMLTDYTLKKFKEVKGLEILGTETTERKIGVIAFNLKDIHPHDVAQILDGEAIAIRSGHHCAMPLHSKLNISSSCRVSFYIYNTKEEIDKMVNVLDNIHKKLHG